MIYQLHSYAGVIYFLYDQVRREGVCTCHRANALTSVSKMLVLSDHVNVILLTFNIKH